MNFPQKSYVEKYQTSFNNWISFNFEHIWKIENFKNISVNTNFKLESSVFSVDDHDLKFKLNVQNFEENNEQFIGLYLYVIIGETIISDAPVVCNFALMDIDKNFKNNTEIHYIFANSENGRGFNKFANYKFLNDLSNKLFDENGQLQISVKGIVNYVKASKFILKQKTLLNSEKNSDVSIIVENTKILTHKAILSAHSPVFETMFSYNDTKEAQKQEIDITDVTIEVFKKFLLFIYTGITPRTKFKELLVVAEKYQVDELKNNCENFFLSSLNNQNVIELYQFADLHNAQKLKENCLSLIVLNFSKIVKTENWEKFCETATSEEIVKITREVSEMHISKK